MTPAALKTLQQIGHELDNDIYPAVYDGGFVMPYEADVSETKGEDKHYERQRTSRSKTGPREGATGWQGPAGKTPSLICTDIQAQYESELDAVYKTYPKTQVWKQPAGILLLTESALLLDYEQSALFLVAIPYDKRAIAKGWGFWGISKIAIEWIGPRHTNFPDGSICAFEPRDGTWMIGDPIVQLLDLYTLWALRHLYMKVFGRWPGYQAVRLAYERILELRPDEYCGCDQSHKLYGDCCQQSDIQRNIVADAIDFIRKTDGGHRAPPVIVSSFILNNTTPPNICDLIQVQATPA